MSTLKEQLDAMIPAESVETRESWGGGPKLSYLTGAYVINRLNQTLGQGNWAYEIANLTRVFEGTIEQAKGPVFTTSYVATVSLTAKIDANVVKFTEVGYGDGTDKKSQGKAHELATKEAVTDAMKRAAKNLGLSLGLGLYFKSGEYIDEAKSTGISESSEPMAKPVAKAAPKSNAKTIREQIKTAFGVLQAQKKVTGQDFAINILGSTQEKVSKLSPEALIKAIEQKILELPDDLAATTKATIKNMYPELPL